MQLCRVDAALHCPQFVHPTVFETPELNRVYVCCKVSAGFCAWKIRPIQLLSHSITITLHVFKE